MELYIQIRDGQPYEHPIFGDNLRDAFPDIDVNNLPPEFARFERVAQPSHEEFPVGFYQLPYVAYEWVDGIVKDVWHVRDMTAEEQSAKQTQVLEGIQIQAQVLKDHAAAERDSATTQEAKDAWQAFIDSFTGWDYGPLESPKFPPPPRIGGNGAVYTTEAPGAAPNVIG